MKPVNFKFNNLQDADMYKVTVTGKFNDILPYESRTANISAFSMDTFVRMFLAYMGNRNWKHKWENCTFGKDFKNGPLQVYLGAFTEDCHFPCINLLWKDIISVNIVYIDAMNLYHECELPDIEELFESEDEFLSQLKDEFDSFNKNDPRDSFDEGVEIVDSYELELVRNILRSTGNWDKEDIDNLFWINRDMGFNSIKSYESNNNFLKILNQEYAKSATGVEYNGFKPETLEKIKNSIMKSDLPDETKTFVIDICSKYDKNNMLTSSEKKDFKDIVESYNICYGMFGSIGPNGWSGIYIEHVTDPEMIDFDDYDENEVIKYNGETYIIKEGD